MKIFFTKRAEKNYRSIKEYITNEWGETVADAFEQRTVDFLDILEDFPEIGVVEVIEKIDSRIPTYQADQSFL